VSKARRSGFTLVELMVAIVLLTILGAILFEVFYQASRVIRMGNRKSQTYANARAILDIIDRDITGLKLGPSPTVDQFACVLGVENAGAGLAGPLSNIGIDQTQLEQAFLSDTLILSSINTSMDDRVEAACFYVLLNDGRFVRAVQHSRELNYTAAIGANVNDYVLANDLKAFNVEYLSDDTNAGTDVPDTTYHGAALTGHGWTSQFDNDADEYDGGNWFNGVSGGDFLVWPQLPTAIRITLRWNDAAADPDDLLASDDILFNHIVYVPAARKVAD
jgi:prepilin-type N-terminal cleavage/methylation domain-containing protein